MTQIRCLAVLFRVFVYIKYTRLFLNFPAQQTTQVQTGVRHFQTERERAREKSAVEVTGREKHELRRECHRLVFFRQVYLAHKRHFTHRARILQTQSVVTEGLRDAFAAQHAQMQHFETQRRQPVNVRNRGQRDN